MGPLIGPIVASRVRWGRSDHTGPNPILWAQVGPGVHMTQETQESLAVSTPLPALAAFSPSYNPPPVHDLV